ncbi:MAG: GNAT family N-acetyltransferase [Pyrinomonadaceae bacterium]|jgi:aminoglycoside 6'-N-acetyltransferase I|nr:GNAT family N-acetyltransferase [Blastocatellia bacterium]MCW5956964.1 GNAT family N-acetyltransferase [Pyrinomonadaceae bacterium]
MAEPNYAVRPLRESDLNEWFRLRKLLWDENEDEDHKAEMLDILGHADSQLVLVADSGNGRLIGFLEASIRPFVEDCVSDHVGYLEGWYVEPDLRRNGIGSELVRFAERWAKQKGCIEMASDAEVGNDSSLAAHTRLGYEETSRLIHLRKDLG